jgi:hypothetical protein
MTKNKPVRRKPISNTPINFRISKEQQDAIKKPPHDSLNRFKNNKGDATDWSNIIFRIHVAVYIARQEYVQDTADALYSVLKLCESVMHHAMSNYPPVWVMTTDQIEIIESGLEAMDDIQDETTRRIQLHAHLYAQKQIKSYKKKYDDYLNKLHA